MALTWQLAGGKRALLLAAGAVALVFAAQPGFAQSADSEAPTAFGQPMPHQYLVNRMTNPAPSRPAGGGAASGAGQAVAEDDDATNGDSPYPKHYLFNRMFDLGGGSSAPAPVASAPAAKTP